MLRACLNFYLKNLGASFIPVNFVFVFYTDKRSINISCFWGDKRSI